ncbi:MAG: hypothetical protein JW791_02005 [Nanoarchaeota archaeon]|nr:hypothetical protein [Nanoarchaeota archaeon]
MKRFLFYFFITIFLVSAANAATVCSETYFKDSVTIYNNMGSPVYYEISAGGKAAIFTSILGDTSFFLSNGESKKISFETYLPFKGVYDLNIIVDNSKTGKTSYHYDFNVTNCHLFNVSVNDLQESYCTNGGINYTLNIENTGIYEESINVNSGRFSFTAIVSPGEVKQYPLTFYEEDVNDNRLQILAENEFYSDYKEYVLNISDCDFMGYEVSDIELCEGDMKTHSLKITNEGVHTDFYNVSTKSKVLELNDTFFVLNPGQSKIIRFNITTSCEDKGYKITSLLVKSSLLGEVIVPVNYNVLNCYDQNVWINEDFNNVCEGDAKNVTFTIENTGVKKNSYDAFFLFGETNLSRYYEVDAGRKVNITLSGVDLPAGDLTAYLLSVSTDSCSLTKEDSATLHVKPYGECYNGFLELQPSFFDNNTKVTVHNNGTRQNTYTMHVFAYNEIDNMSFTLDAGQSSTFTLTPLMLIHKEYGVESFQVVMEGNNAYGKANTTYYDNGVTGLIMRTATNASLITGFTLFLIIVYAFVKKEIKEANKY